MEIKIGDKVQLSAKFLRSTATYMGPIPFMKGIVKDVYSFNHFLGKGPKIAVVNWDIPDYPEKILTSNLNKLGHLEAD